MVPVREELPRGDLWALYLGWLSGLWLEMDEPDDIEALEPTVPAGLKNLWAAQTALAGFLGVDRALLDAAAEASGELVRDESGLAQWITTLSSQEKDEPLISAATGATPNVGLLLARRFANSGRKHQDEPQKRRSVDQLLGGARLCRDEREEAKRRCTHCRACPSRGASRGGTKKVSS
jgi:hypothetical protein